MEIPPMNIHARLKELVGQQVAVDDPTMPLGSQVSIGTLVDTGNDSYSVENEAGEPETMFSAHQVIHIQGKGIQLELPLNWDSSPEPLPEPEPDSWFLYEDDPNDYDENAEDPMEWS